jgi:hypothetical protein
MFKVAPPPPPPVTAAGWAAMTTRMNCSGWSSAHSAIKSKPPTSIRVCPSSRWKGVPSVASCCSGDSSVDTSLTTASVPGLMRAAAPSAPGLRRVVVVVAGVPVAASPAAVAGLEVVGLVVVGLVAACPEAFEVVRPGVASPVAAFLAAFLGEASWHCPVSFCDFRISDFGCWPPEYHKK